MPHPQRLRTLVVATWLQAACVGSIDGQPEPARAGSPMAPAAPGAGTAVSCPTPVSPGRVTVHRLNRVEYDNTVRDLLGDTTRPAQSFVADDVESDGGFDNNAEVLSVDSQLLANLYDAAQKLAQTAVASPRIMTCTPATPAANADCARQILAPLARRAWRRSVTPAEVNELLGTVRLAETQGDTFARGMELAIRRVLLSPKFIFRLETLAEPSSLRPQALDGFALASRLSYFLWRSMPDDTLLAAAEAGRLADAGELDSQVTRMLADARSSALIQDLSRQWLMGHGTETAAPDPVLHKGFDVALRRGLQSETSLFLGEFMGKNLNLQGMLDADFSFLNDRVARHYGIAGVMGANFRKVSLSGNPQRGGLLTQGNIHVGTMTDPKFTSLEYRGVWVLQRLLCAKLPPPPGDADQQQVAIVAKLGPNPSKKQVSAARSASPTCGACHVLFDPLGFALEGYDVSGAWRTMDRGQPIDARGELPGLGAFDGAKELSTALKKDERFGSCVAETLATFALGRTMHESDRCTIAAIVEQAATKGYGGQDLLKAVVQSAAFRQQTGEPN